MGTGAVLGLAPAPDYTFLIYVSPVGNYFKVFAFVFLCNFLSSSFGFLSLTYLLQEGVAPINLIVENDFHRATPGGTGGVKTIGNYAAVSQKLKAFMNIATSVSKP